MIIPIFPLTIVQFPGVITPLHIFEPRYRKMMKDILAADKTFGILYPGEGKEDETPEIHRVGCTVEVIAHEEQSDGRSNILCAGKDRFRILKLIEGEPYYQAEVEVFEDDLTFDSLTEPTERAKELFLRIIAAGKKMRDLSEAEENQTPDLPDDSVALSFIISASLDVELDEKQLWLEMTSTGRRLSILSNHLKELVETYELRAQVHKIARTNGRAGKPPDIA
ncbi:MAG: LON peptidase substrate-binding domain-containing protein [Acidobacteria bacterium]|nr:LON peptidase substrate-binding domain-containing protein [Acidobacteriota bacterium]